MKRARKRNGINIFEDMLVRETGQKWKLNDFHSLDLAHDSFAKNENESKTIKLASMVASVAVFFLLFVWTFTLSIYRQIESELGRRNEMCDFRTSIPVTVFRQRHLQCANILKNSDKHYQQSQSCFSCASIENQTKTRIQTIQSI